MRDQIVWTFSTRAEFEWLTLRPYDSTWNYDHSKNHQDDPKQHIHMQPWLKHVHHPKNGWLDTKKNRHGDIVGHFVPNVWARTRTNLWSSNSMVRQSHLLHLFVTQIIMPAAHFLIIPLEFLRESRAARDTWCHHGSSFSPSSLPGSFRFFVLAVG